MTKAITRGPLPRHWTGNLAASQPLPDSPRARKWLREQEVLGDDNRFLVAMVESWVRFRHEQETRLREGGAA